jgi:hypothetical protein
MDEQRDAADVLLATGLAREVWGAESLAIAVAGYLRAPIPSDLRKKQIAELMKRLSQTRTEVADDLCGRISRFANSAAHGGDRA